MKKRAGWLWTILALILLSGAILTFSVLMPRETAYAMSAFSDLGLIVREGTENLTVIAVEENSPAGHSRIMPGDCLTRIEDVSVNSIDLLDQCIRESTASRLCFYYLHNGHEEYFTVLVRR